MNAFLSNVRSNFGNRETTIKESILTNLAENVKEIQFEVNENSTEEPLTHSDGTNSLCTTVESLFLHGLKDSFLRQTINVIAGEDDRRPEPNFWPPMLIFIHKQTIEQIQNLTQVNTDIGYCRSWIRLSLNENLLSAYLSNIRKNQSALSPYYKRYAFLRDGDNVALAESIIGGIEAFVTFSLPYNSSLLNQWTYHSLQMAGLYTPPLRSCPISAGIDVASSLPSASLFISIPKPVQTNEIFSQSISNSPFATSPLSPISTATAVELNEDDNLSLLLSKIDEMHVEKATEIAEAPKSDEDLHAQSGIMGNSITTKTCWSSIDNDQIKQKTDVTLSRSNSMTASINSLRSPFDRHSYNSLLARHINKGDGYERTVDLKDVWERFESSLGIADETGIIGTSNNNEDDRDETIANFGFELITPDINEKFSIQELQNMVQQSCRLAHEMGIDSQGFICKSCPNPLGVGSTGAQVCSFSGYYYCTSCMSNDLHLIPAKVIYNWDFRKYLVSKQAAAFLDEFQYQPFIDLKLLNPEIYMSVDEMAFLQSLRIQLNFIRAYLFTCCASIITKLQKLMWTKEYLYEHIHRYSIADLHVIPKGCLAQQLHKTVMFGQAHILDCRLCSQKGFICEICNSAKVLYPFNIETTYRCELCGSVFHDHCLNSTTPCPKCERKRRREDLPLLEAVNSQKQ